MASMLRLPDQKTCRWYGVLAPSISMVRPVSRQNGQNAPSLPVCGNAGRLKTGQMSTSAFVEKNSLHTCRSSWRRSSALCHRRYSGTAARAATSSKDSAASASAATSPSALQHSVRPPIVNIPVFRQQHEARSETTGQIDESNWVNAHAASDLLGVWHQKMQRATRVDTVLHPVHPYEGYIRTVMVGHSIMTWCISKQRISRAPCHCSAKQSQVKSKHFR